jgi:hypothetical protein
MLLARVQNGFQGRKNLLTILGVDFVGAKLGLGAD